MLSEIIRFFVRECDFRVVIYIKCFSVIYFVQCLTGSQGGHSPKVRKWFVLDLRISSSLALVNAILCAPGKPHEFETCLIDGRLLRVYKNIWPSLRVFWLSAAKDHAEKTYVVYEKRRYTFQQVFESSIKAAAMYRDVYDIRKGVYLSFPLSCWQITWYSQVIGSLYVLGIIPISWLLSGLAVCPHYSIVRFVPSYLDCLDLIGAVSVLVNASV